MGHKDWGPHAMFLVCMPVVFPCFRGLLVCRMTPLLPTSLWGTFSANMGRGVVAMAFQEGGGNGKGSSGGGGGLP